MSKTKNNLNFDVASDIDQLLAAIEIGETWPIKTDKFYEGQRHLNELLAQKRSGMNPYKFRDEFILVEAFSGFRDAMALMRALAAKHGDILDSLLAVGMTGKNEAPYWMVHSMRIAWLARVQVLCRVFSRERIDTVKKALTRSGSQQEC